MCDSKDSSDFSDDQKRPSVTRFESKLKKLNFTNYEAEKYLEDAAFLVDFDETKLKVEKEDANMYNIFYDNRPLSLASKAFSVLIKKVRNSLA